MTATLPQPARARERWPRSKRAAKLPQIGGRHERSFTARGDSGVDGDRRGRRQRPRRRLAAEDRHLDRALSGRRRFGRLRAARRRRHGRQARPADGDRQQERRRRHRGHRRGGARAGRRLHVAAGRHRPHLCAADLSQCRLRFPARLRADQRGRPRALRAGGQPGQAQCLDAGRVHRRGQEAARRHRYRLGRRRHRDAPRHRPVRSARRGEAQPCALSRRRAHAAGPAGRAR